MDDLLEQSGEQTTHSHNQQQKQQLLLQIILTIKKSLLEIIHLIKLIQI